MVHANPETFDHLMSRPVDQLVVAYFWGPECPNCEVFAADLPTLMETLPSNVEIVKVNAYQHPDLARRFSLFGIPGFVLFRGGTKLGMMRQYYGRAYWTQVVAELAQGQAPTKRVD